MPLVLDAYNDIASCATIRITIKRYHWWHFWAFVGSVFVHLGAWLMGAKLEMNIELMGAKLEMDTDQ